MRGVRAEQRLGREQQCHGSVVMTPNIGFIRGLPCTGRIYQISCVTIIVSLGGHHTHHTIHCSTFLERIFCDEAG